MASGAVKLSTLDGEIMSNWISGCRLKKYHLPLTNEMLERMHAAKNMKEAAASQKQDAQDEAQERIKKNKQRRAMVVALMSTPTKNQALHPYIPV